MAGMRATDRPLNFNSPLQVFCGLMICLLLAGSGLQCSNDSGTSIDTELKSEQKISETRGNFDGNLSIGDEFGSAVTSIGDLEADGVTDLAVGAPFDDDDGTDRGALWILFMDSDGKVDTEQKISSRDGKMSVWN